MARAPRTVICDYCGKPAKLVTGKVIYPHRPDLAKVKAWRCDPCEAHVGCHPGTDKPKGRLANMELRNWKMLAHAYFDPIWKKRFEEKRDLGPTYKRHHARGGRYKRLAGLMGLTMDEMHIGMLDVEQCRRVVELCKSGAVSED